MPSFGSEGTIQLPSHVIIEALGFSADGGALVVGSHDVAGEGEPGVVMRFHSDGTWDSGFGTDGRVTLRPGGREFRARTFVSATGGRLLVGGTVRRRFAMVRLLPDGRPDPRFGSGGWLFPSVAGTVESLMLSRVGPRIYLAGVARNGDRLRVVLMRFDRDGRPDLSFGRHGRRTARISEKAKPKAILPTRSGILVVLGRGPRPLIQFGRNGGVRRLSVGNRPKFVGDIRATVSGGRLILGWSEFSYAVRRDAYYLGTRALP